MNNNEFNKKIRIFFLILSYLFCIDCHAAIHVFGDSHSREFSLVPHCQIHPTDAVTMHRVGRDGLSFLNIRNVGVAENDIAIFCFGEVDARCHIGKQRDEAKRDLYEIIESLVKPYIKTILLNQASYNNLTCVIYSVTPPTNAAYNPAYPFYGSIEDRIFITKLLNHRLEKWCIHYGLKFLNVYNDYANPDGSFNMAYSDGGVHIESNHYQFIWMRLLQLFKN